MTWNEMGTWTSRLFLVFCYHILLLFDIGGSQSVNAGGYGGIQSDTNINTDIGTGTGNQPNGLIDSELVQGDLRQMDKVLYEESWEINEILREWQYSFWYFKSITSHVITFRGH